MCRENKLKGFFDGYKLETSLHVQRKLKHIGLLGQRFGNISACAEKTAKKNILLEKQ